MTMTRRVREELVAPLPEQMILFRPARRCLATRRSFRLQRGMMTSGILSRTARAVGTSPARFQRLSTLSAQRNALAAARADMLAIGRIALAPPERESLTMEVAVAVPPTMASRTALVLDVPPDREPFPTEPAALAALPDMRSRTAFALPVPKDKGLRELIRVAFPVMPGKSSRIIVAFPAAPEKSFRTAPALPAPPEASFPTALALPAPADESPLITFANAPPDMNSKTGPAPRLRSIYAPLQRVGFTMRPTTVAPLKCRFRVRRFQTSATCPAHCRRNARLFSAPTRTSTSMIRREIPTP